MDRFVKPEVERLPISLGDTIDIKKRLNHGETEDMYARWAPLVTVGAERQQLNRREVRTAKVLAYLLGWSLTNDGKPVPMAPELPEAVRIAAINNLDPDTFDEIHQAIGAHEDAQHAARAAQKKILPGSPDAAATSASPSAVAGESSGSVS